MDMRTMLFSACVLLMLFLPLDGSHVKQGQISAEEQFLCEAYERSSLDDEAFISVEEYLSHDIKFYLFTRKNPTKGCKIKVNDTKLLHNCRYNKGKKTKFIIHGFLSSSFEEVASIIKNAYMKAGETNVITVDWSAIAWNINYFQVAVRTKVVGEYVADMVAFLVDVVKTKLQNIHLIGHSLGSHVAGFAGARVKELLKGRGVSRITGLDVALPCFALKEVSGRLDASDAEFVDVIHTGAGPLDLGLGFAEPVGHADFYPNGGKWLRQPGCGGEKDCVSLKILPPLVGCKASTRSFNISEFKTRKKVAMQTVNHYVEEVYGKRSSPFCCYCCLNCAHSRAYEFFAESITSKRGFGATKCDSWEGYEEGRCRWNLYTLMGERVSNRARGTFYLRTRSVSPFAISTATCSSSSTRVALLASLSVSIWSKLYGS